MRRRRDHGTSGYLRNLGTTFGFELQSSLFLIICGNGRANVIKKVSCRFVWPAIIERSQQIIQIQPLDWSKPR